MRAPAFLVRDVSSLMKICRPLIGFIINVKYFFLNAMFIYYCCKKWSLLTRMFCYIYLGSEKCTGGLRKFSRLIHCVPGPEVIKLFFMLNSVVNEILNTHMLFFPIINVKMPTIVGILTFMSRKIFMLS